MNGLTPAYDVKYNLRHRRNFKNINLRTEKYRNSCFPYCTSEWENFSDEIMSWTKLSQFKNKLLESIRDPKRSSFGINDIPGIETKLRVEFSDLLSHRFSHYFNCITPICSYLLDEESNSYSLLRCLLYAPIRNNFFGNVSLIIGSDISLLPSEHLTCILLYGSNVYSNITNKLLPTETIEFIRKYERFNNLGAVTTRGILFNLT